MSDNFTQTVQRIDHVLDQIQHYTTQGMIVVTRNNNTVDNTHEQQEDIKRDLQIQRLVTTYQPTKRAISNPKTDHVQDILHGGQTYQQYTTNIKY